ncbi:MAG: PilW family protein [Pseudomonadota bacterium]
MRRARGFSLLELIIALAIGLTLLAAFLVVLQRCRTAFAANESFARLQDSARHALSVVVPDIELAGFFGFTNQPVSRLVTALPSGIQACGTNFATALALAAQGSDNIFRAGEDARDCAPSASAHGARAGSDTLTLRHASRSTTAPHAGRLQLYSQSLASAGPLLLFADGRAPGPVNIDHEVRDLEVRLYYIATSSVERPEWPALRVKALTESGGAAQFRDEEVLPGVEDLQVELGVASRTDSGELRTYFVAPDAPRARDGPIVAVRLWLRIRADATEPGFNDDRALSYANVNFIPSAAESRQRRLLIERTVTLRNARLP